MSAYWMGVLSLPALVLALGAAYGVVTGLSWLIGKVGAWGIQLVRKESTQADKVPIAATTYGARRVYMWAANRWGVVLLVDIDFDEVKEGAARLRTSRRQITVNPHPRPKTDTSEVPLT